MYQNSVSAQPTAAPAGPAAPAGNDSTVDQGKQTGEAALLDKVLSQMDERLEAALAKFTREQQGQRDKMEARVAQKLSEALDVAKAAGVTVDAGKRRDIESHVRGQVKREFESESSQPAGSPAGKTDGEGQPTGPADELTQLAWGIMDDEGVDLEDTDPELSLIDTTGNKTKFIKSVMKAIEAKRERLARGNTPLAGGMSAGGDEASVLAQLNALLAHPSKENLPKINELRERLRQIGK